MVQNQDLSGPLALEPAEGCKHDRRRNRASSVGRLAARDPARRVRTHGWQDGPSFEINGFVIKKERSRPGVKSLIDVKSASCAISEPFVRDLNFRKETGSTAIPREPVRDWRLGWMSGHRARVIAFTVSVIAVLLASHSLPPAGRPAGTLVEEIVSWMSLLWLGALLPGSLGLIGTLGIVTSSK
jgi:hypothetical protein